MNEALKKTTRLMYSRKYMKKHKLVGVYLDIEKDNDIIEFIKNRDSTLSISEFVKQILRQYIYINIGKEEKNG